MKKRKKRRPPVITFKEVGEIYKKKKLLAGEGDFGFVASIFSDIHDEYIKRAKKQGKDANQSWNAWSGKNFQKLIAYIIKDFIETSKGNLVSVTDDDALRSDKLEPELDRVRRNIEVFYSNYAIVPDADIIIYDKSNFQVIAVLSCKASLRERVAQAAYWKIKLQTGDTTKNVLCYLVSSDKDGDFENIGKDISRNRIIVEFGELDGAYILRQIPESQKVKHFNKIFADLKLIFDKWFQKK